MTSHPPTDARTAGELLEGQVMNLEIVARICAVSPDWLRDRIETEVLPPEWRHTPPVMSAAVVWRIRQIATLETRFEADPHLAALVTDLMEEVRELRRRLKTLEP